MASVRERVNRPKINLSRLPPWQAAANLQQRMRLPVDFTP